MIPTKGKIAKVIPSSMGSFAWLSMVINWLLGVFEESTKTTIMSEEMKNHDEEEDWVHTWEVKKKKKRVNFHEKEQSKGGKTKVVLSIMPCDATYVLMKIDTSRNSEVMVTK